MARVKHIPIIVKDCSLFENDAATADVLQKFISTQQASIFRFSSKDNSDEDSRLAEFDYRCNSWRAGRFVGEAFFNHHKSSYKITIEPRFGEKMLIRMLEEIFNIRITSSMGEPNKKTDWQHLIRRIIALIWLQKLANANLHGVPRVQVKKEHRGTTVRGRLNVRKSIKTLHSSKEVVSTFREKHIDITIAKIVLQAYRILKKDFEMGAVSFPDSAQDAMDQIHAEVKDIKHIHESEYNNIRYRDIYLSWKSVTDMSWDIIRRNQHSLKQDKGNKSFGFFIDMAEVWEQYLRLLLAKNLSPRGWRYVSEKQTAYKDYFWERTLIPDLVFEKGDEVCVWDAKYKLMTGDRFDVDRTDFFQIHTYIQYQMNHKIVRAGGLLYPISTTADFSQYRSLYFIRDGGLKMNFAIDGIELRKNQDLEDLKTKEQEFIDRMIGHLG
jgi:5-methylcytosine-specific restriction enzyme subunit McrC